MPELYGMPERYSRVARAAGDDELEEAEDTLAQIRTWLGLDDAPDTVWVVGVRERGRELERLRARDEKATAVVQWWRKRNFSAPPPEGAALLDDLARAHDEDQP